MTSKSLSIPSTISAGTTPKPRFLETFARRALLSRLSRITNGEITLHDGDTQQRFGRVTAQCPLRVTVTVTNPRFYTDTAFGGSIGAGEAFMAG
ncbi:MAG: hypothetical protein KC584_19610, partial [Nitrospira sp.]|nr:hypothetical protein [Nitrospira sp.]